MIRSQTNINLDDRRSAPKTAQQLFRRIDKTNSQQSRISKSSKQKRNFPSLNTTSMKNFFNKGKSLDNSKQNLMFQNFLEKVNSASKIDQKLIVSNYLNLIRKDYDKMHKQTKQHMSSISMKKKDIQFLKERVKAQQQSVNSLQAKFKQKNSLLKSIQQKQQEVQTQKKTLDHIIFRMKKDQIFFKQYGREFQGQLNQKRKVLKSLNQNILSQDQRIHKLVVHMEQMKQQFKKNQEFRQRKLQDYCQKLQNIHQKEVFIQQRKQRTLELQSIQSNDILKAKNIQMRNICLINKLADSLFQSKLQKLIEKYSHIQNAFHTIQIKTSINDPTLIANKFFSYEQLTQNLLKSITNYEKILQQKTKRNQILKEQFRKLQQNEFNNDNGQMNQNTSQRKLTQNQLQELNQRHLCYQRVLNWIQKQGKRLKILENQQQNVNQIEKITSMFHQVCMKTKLQTIQVGKTIKKPQKYITPGIRIKKLIKQANLDYRTQKFRQIQQLQEINLSQNEYLKAARAGVKRNFTIKQKTVNMGVLALKPQTKPDNLISDRKLRSSQNR